MSAPSPYRLVEVVGRKIRPVVDGEEIIGGPALPVATYPGDAFVDSALHLKHVGDRLLNPGIT